MANIVYAKFHQNAPTSALLFLTFTIGVTLGAGYELLEYSEDVLTGSSRLGDGPDTGNDLLMDFIGAALATLSVRSWYKRKN